MSQGEDLKVRPGPDRTDERRAKSNEMTTDDEQPIHPGYNINERLRLEDVAGHAIALRDDDGPHEWRLSENGRNFNRRNAYGVLGRHRFILVFAPCSRVPALQDFFRRTNP